MFRKPHWISSTPTYKSWEAMLSRCKNPNRPNFSRYGGRGILVCVRWECFDNFLADMGERPQGTTIDRVDVDGNYEPGNCRWATQRDQSINRRSNKVLTYRGQTKLISQWADELGITRSCLTRRIQRGWTVEKALGKEKKEMRMTEVTITRRKNLGSYEHEEVSLTAVIEESDNAAECIASVKQEVLYALGLSVDPVPTTKPVAEPAVPQAAKKTPAKKTPAKVEEVKPEPAPVVEEVKPEPVPVVEEVKPAKKKAVKMVPYNRDEQSHKTEFAKVLVSINPNWQTECAQLAKAASVALNGTDMLDENGKVIGSFVEQVKAAITAEADL